MFDNDAIAARLAALETDTGMSPARRDLAMRLAVWGHIPSKFLMEHGKDYATNEDSFAGPRMEAKQCFMNAAIMAMENPELTYVEGKVACHGLPIDHAWCVDWNDMVVDPTIRDNADGHISDYYGVAFQTRYLKKAIIWNGFYGLLDYFVANSTAPKLYELGLEAGQQWLLDQKKKPKRTKKAAR